jgi:hypothetical protein
MEVHHQAELESKQR